MPKPMKVIMIVVACILAMLVVTAGTRGMKEIRTYQLPPIDMAVIADGDYNGACTISRWAMHVKVTVKDRKVTAIDVVDNTKSNLTKNMLAKLNQKIIETQSPKVDAVSGASITTKAFTIAVAEALRKGMP